MNDIQKLKVIIDKADWNKLEPICHDDPAKFFGHLTIRYLGIRRIKWLYDVSRFINHNFPIDETNNHYDLFADFVFITCKNAIDKANL